MSYIAESLDLQRDRQWRSFYRAEADWSAREDPYFYMQEPPEEECRSCHDVLGYGEGCSVCDRYRTQR